MKKLKKNQLNNKTLLAIDFGTKVTGLAIFAFGRDPYPTPFGKIPYKNDKQLRQEILQVIENECVDLVILGLPLFTDGKESKMTKKVQKFGDYLHQDSPSFELYFQDETLSSYEAQERMKNSPLYNFKVDPKKIDALAASIILEDFINEILE